MMLTTNPQHRISAKIALDHPYFEGITPENLPMIVEAMNSQPLTEIVEKKYSVFQGAEEDMLRAE